MIFVQEGGCFHSRTAMGMFDHVKQAVEKGDVLLEWDYSKVRAAGVGLVMNRLKKVLLLRYSSSID